MGHGDGLKTDSTSRCQTPVQYAEVGGPPPLPHCFNHLNADDGVVGSDRISVVLHSNIDHAAQSLGRNPLSSQCCLLIREGQAGHAGAPSRRPERQLAPPRPDFEQSGALLDAGDIKQPLDLVELGLGPAWCARR